jgi:hypothetical protein
LKSPKNELGRNSIEHEQCPEDQDNEEIDGFLIGACVFGRSSLAAVVINICLPPDSPRRGLLLRRPWIWVEGVLCGGVVAAAMTSLELLFPWPPFRVVGVSSVTEWPMDLVQESWCGQLIFGDLASSSASACPSVFAFILVS